MMEGERFVGYSPEDVFWAEDGRTLYFTWNPDLAPEPSLYSLSIQNGKPLGAPEKVSLEAQKSLVAAGGAYTQDRSKKLFTRNGDIFLYQAGQVRQISNTIEAETNPTFSADEKHLVFNRGGNLFIMSLTDGSWQQLSDFRPGEEKPEPKPSAQQQWLENQQMALISVLKDRKERAEARKKENEALEPPRPKTYYQGKKQLSNLILSPRQDYITFRLTQEAPDAPTLVPNYVTESGYTDEGRARPKVGSPLSTHEFGIYDLKRDTIFLVDFKQLPGIYDLPAYYQEYQRVPKDSMARPVVAHGPFWSKNGQYAVLVVRSQDSKDRWIVRLNPATGQLTLLDRQRDEAWVGGPGIGGGWFSAGNVGWLPDQEHFFFQSEKTGYSHLYTVEVKTGNIRALTQGQFEVSQAYLSRDQKQWYLLTNALHPGEYHFYSLPLAGGTMTQITSQTGMHEVFPSPDEKYLASRFSYSNQPWELYLMPNQPKAKALRLTQSQTPAFRQYPWREPQIITFAAQDNAQVYARLYRPAQASPGGKAVIFVHGAGYLQNAHKGWSIYFREYMFHNLLVDRGYTVLDIDYRASQGYGRDWRTAIYRHMGGKDLSDQVDGAKYLIEQHGIAPDRIGIYGGSYGGFITLMALFNAPQVFKAGAALRSVTDWAHYNHGYTSNILNTPVLDSLAYQRSSPINFAEGLQGHLLMCHGVLDDNVQFQDIVRLTQRLIELRKENWELAIYPLEPHGFREPSSWADEYKRILKLFEENL
ncbi:MAG: prolyl oligopeptidase family serine peptidase [Microscillaceae bacterium]